MAMSVSPGSRSSPGFCHICRQRNRSAQKQIICPIYRGPTACPPLQDGPGTKYFGQNQDPPGAPRIEPKLTLSKIRNPDFLRPIQRVTGLIESGRYRAAERSKLRRHQPIEIYSAAAAKDGFRDGFRFAADIMKSEIRGTISDLKREPLNTP